MGRKTDFTEFEANQIRKLINKKLIASKNEQKAIRNKIRSFGFYFSDFSSKKGYTVQDFENLIKTGEIKIVGQKIIENRQLESKLKINIQNSTKKKPVIENKEIENELIINGKFCSIKDLNQNILKSTGFYCVRLKENSRLPDRYQSILDQRKHKIIYIGKAKLQSGQTQRMDMYINSL